MTESGEEFIPSEYKWQFKTCTKCHTSKPLKAYNKCATTDDGLQYWCRECFHNYYAKKNGRPEVHIRESPLVELHKPKVKRITKTSKVRNVVQAKPKFIPDDEAPLELEEALENLKYVGEKVLPMADEITASIGLIEGRYSQLRCWEEDKASVRKLGFYNFTLVWNGVDGTGTITIPLRGDKLG